jgi:ribosomal protein S12 methylthiotransferase accessory factor YcaO
MERKGMDNEQRRWQQPPTWDPSSMISSPTSRPARQHARNRALAWVSAITLGAGAASAVGAVAVVASLPGTTSAMSSTAAGTTTSGTTGSQLQAGKAPTTTNIPPVATSGAS